jgi:archaetidylinositol phosphate synthase
VRFNESFVAAYERQLLHAIAGRLPAAVTPDRLTAFGVFGALVEIAGYILSAQQTNWLWLANLGLIFHWLGDSLDGTVARVRCIERPRYGFYLDQVVDTLGNTLIALGVGLAPWIRMDLVLIILALYHMLSIQVYVRAIVDHEFHLAVGRLGPTEMRLGILGLNCLVMLLGEPRPISAIYGATWPDALVALLGIALLALYGMQMKHHLARFALEDPRRTRASD